MLKFCTIFLVNCILITKQEFIQSTKIDNDERYATFDSFLYETSKSFTQFQDSAIKLISEQLSPQTIINQINKFTLSNPSLTEKQQTKQQKNDLINFKQEDKIQKRSFNVTMEKQEQNDKQQQKKTIKNLQKEIINRNSQEKKRRNLHRIYEENGDGEYKIGYDYQKLKSELAQPCQNGGRAVTVKDKYFICNGDFVEYQEFMTLVLKANDLEGQQIVEDHQIINWPEIDEQGNVSYYNSDDVTFDYQNYDLNAANCTVYNGWAEACLCPSDSYGVFCESKNDIKCDMSEPVENLIQSDNCIYNQVDYNKNLDGDAPCNPVRGQENIIVQLRINCQNELEAKESITLKYTDSYVTYFDKKVKKGQDMVYPDPKKFTYSFDESYQNDGDDTTIQLISNDPVIFSPKLTVINWHKFSQSYVQDYMRSDNSNQLVSYNLTASQLKSENPFSIMIDLADIPSNLQQYGRYTVQIDIMQERKSEVVDIDGVIKKLDNYQQVTPKINLFLDDINYVKPIKEKKDNTWVYIVIGVLIFIIIVLLIFIIYYYQKKRNQKKAIANLQPEEEQQFQEY